VPQWIEELKKIRKPAGKSLLRKKFHKSKRKILYRENLFGKNMRMAVINYQMTPHHSVGDYIIFWATGKITATHFKV